MRLIVKVTRLELNRTFPSRRNCNLIVSCSLKVPRMYLLLLRPWFLIRSAILPCGVVDIPSGQLIIVSWMSIVKPSLSNLQSTTVLLSI